MAVNGGHAGTRKGPNWGHVRALSLDFSELFVEDCFLLSVPGERVGPESRVG